MSDDRLNSFGAVPEDMPDGVFMCENCEENFTAEPHVIHRPEHTYHYPGKKDVPGYTYTRPAHDVELCDECYKKWIGEALDDMGGDELVEYIRAHATEPCSAIINALEKGKLK